MISVTFHEGNGPQAMMSQFNIPDFLSHYYERSTGPFSNLSMLPMEQAEQILNKIRRDGNRFASRRSEDYLARRRGIEDKIRKLFVEKGGEPKLTRPHYMILGTCVWLKEWYLDGQELQIKLALFRATSLSFTFGDSFPAMNYQDGKPYRGQVYTLSELEEMIRCYGLPQVWNPDGKAGPERYIEAQVWDDAPLRGYLLPEAPCQSGQSPRP
jgi:hypothetical protein